MHKLKVMAVAIASCAFAVGASAQQAVITIDGDDVTLMGCVVPAVQGSTWPTSLIWTRGEIMLAGVDAAAGAPVNAIGTSGLAGGRVFYWLDADDLRPHIGQRVEIKGELEDFEQGEIKIERDDDFTEIELEIDGDSEEVRVPTAWLGTTPDDVEFTFAARKVDVDDIRVLGVCSR